MKPYEGLGLIKPRKLGCTALLGCLLVPVLLVAVLRSNSQSFAILSFQLSIHTYLPSSTVEESNSSEPQGGITILPLASLTEEQRENKSIRGQETTNLPFPFGEDKLKNNSNAGGMTTIATALKEDQGRNESVTDKEKMALSIPSAGKHGGDNPNAGLEITKLPLQERQGERDLSGVDIAKLLQPIHLKEKLRKNSSTSDNAKESSHVSNEKQEQNFTIAGNLIQQSKLICDYSGKRSDTCIMDGNVKVLGKYSTIILVSSSQPRTAPEISKIRPYARKWEAPVMASIREISLKSSVYAKQTPHCAVNHTIPAVVFSTGGFLGNLFHDFNDVLIPLFVTSRQHNGEVQFLVTNFNSQWINKYQPILRRLSHYQIINMDTDGRVHCFPYAHVGLKSYKVLGIDPSKTPNGYSMADFREFLRACFSLKRKATKRTKNQSRKKPRLLILLRKGSRSFTNERAVIVMARRVGYKVITAGPEETKDLRRFTQIVNSCDVMMGVHGAGLTNMVFLPTNATLIQIIPWGQLSWACRHNYGEPSPDMGIRYLEYEIREEESSLVEQFPRDHAVFKDPLSIHEQGFNAIWSIFLNKQKVNLDVNRFRGVLLEVFQSLKQ